MKTVAIIGAGAAGMFCADKFPVKESYSVGRRQVQFYKHGNRRRQPKSFLSARGGIFEEAAYGVRLRKDPRIF